MTTERNAQGVDPLAVMDFHIADMAGQGTRVNQRNELIEARAAVAELVAAARYFAETYSGKKSDRLRAAIAKFSTEGQ